MIRCALAVALAAIVQVAAAQAPRSFPAHALRGEILITQPPELLLNQAPGRLAPGARIRGTDNMMVLSGTAVNRRLLVHYTLDLHGHLLDVWVLTPAELSRKPWPTTSREAAIWSFNPDTQVWSRP